MLSILLLSAACLFSEEELSSEERSHTFKLLPPARKGEGATAAHLALQVFGGQDAEPWGDEGTGAIVTVEHSPDGEAWFSHESSDFPAPRTLEIEGPFMPFVRVTVKPFGRRASEGVSSVPRPKVGVTCHLCSSGPVRVSKVS